MKMLTAMPKTIISAAKRNGHITELWSEGEDGYWGLIENGWCFEGESVHAVHEQTARDFVDAIGRILPCRCVDFRAAK